MHFDIVMKGLRPVDQRMVSVRSGRRVGRDFVRIPMDKTSFAAIFQISSSSMLTILSMSRSGSDTAG